jgi:signal transduction histidine kinase
VNEVSCRVWELFVEASRRHGVSLAELIAVAPGAPLADPTQRIDWDTFCVLLVRLEELLPPGVGLEEIGSYAAMNPLAKPLRVITSSLADARLLYRAAYQWLGPSLVRGLALTLEDLGHRRLRITSTIPPTARDSPQFHRTTIGAARTLPRVLGLPDAVVHAELGPRRLVLDVTLPPTATLLQRLRRIPSALRSARSIISELVWQQEELRASHDAVLRSQRDLRAVIETLPDGVVIQRAGRILYANPAALGSLGARVPRELAGRAFDELVHPHDRARLGDPGHVEVRLGDPPRATALLSPAQAVEFDGGPAQLVVLRDLTALRRSEEENRALLAAIPDLILRLDEHGKILDVHSGQLRQTPAGAVSLAGLDLAALPTIAPGLDRRAVDDALSAIATALATGLTQMLTITVPTNAGPRVWETRFVPLGAPRGTEVLAIARDVTEQKHAEAGLALADRMLSVGTLAAGVAHEINNPLTYVIANLRGLARRVRRIAGGKPIVSSELPDLEQMIGDALDGAERVRDIVGDLKTFSRGDDEEAGPIDVRAVLDTSIKMAQNEIRHRARLVRQYADDVPSARATSARLGQVFLNLLLNAAQAIPEGHAGENEITVRVYGAGADVAVEIIDTGVGIPPEIAARIFDPFFTTKPALGTGLGLAICHKIVSALGGEIVALSTPGRGATFRLRLPAAQRPAILPLPPQTTAEREAIARRRVLIVDDEPRVAEALAAALEGHDVELAASGREALSRLGGGTSFDIVFCDLLMPEVSGMDLYRELVRSRPALARRVVFMTAGAFTQGARDFLAAVPNACIEKPFDMDAVLSLIGRS